VIRFDFQQRVALVTGGTKGIGRAIVAGLLRGQARVVVTYSRDESAATAFQNSLSAEEQSRVHLLKSDVSCRADVHNLFRKPVGPWGEPISLVVNNAGILKQGDFQDLSDEQWDQTFAVNLKGPFMVGQEFLKHGPDGGAVVNISSIGGQTGGNRAPDYAASKAGLISLTRSLARLGTARGMRVNAVSPGWIVTDIFTEDQLIHLQKEATEVIPLGRMGKPEEVASAVLYLLSEEASFITGHCLNVNGGLYFG
jgi:3-oxoacyl-[acyl-carrier protein] reductase